jgi:hypothetical protein
MKPKQARRLITPSVEWPLAPQHGTPSMIRLFSLCNLIGSGGMRRLLRLGHLPAVFALCLFLLP